MGLLMEIDELCECLGIGKNTAYNLLNTNQIDAFKIGSVWKIPRKAVDEYINREISKEISTRKKIEMVEIVK